MEAYITVVEQASSKLPAQEADEVRSDVSCLLRQHHTQCKNQCNLNPHAMQVPHTTKARHIQGGTHS